MRFLTLFVRVVTASAVRLLLLGHLRDLVVDLWLTILKLHMLVMRLKALLTVSKERFDDLAVELNDVRVHFALATPCRVHQHFFLLFGSSIVALKVVLLKTLPVRLLQFGWDALVVRDVLIDLHHQASPIFAAHPRAARLGPLRRYHHVVGNLINIGGQLTWLDALSAAEPHATLHIRIVARSLVHEPICLRVALYHMLRRHGVLRQRLKRVTGQDQEVWLYKSAVGRLFRDLDKRY